VCMCLCVLCIDVVALNMYTQLTLILSQFTTSLSQIDLLTEQIGVLQDQNTTTQEQVSDMCTVF